MSNQFQDDPPIIGGGRLPDHLLVSTDGDVVPSDDLGQQLYWLQKSNPGVLKFRQADILSMDDATKMAMIASMQHALGLRPLSDCIR